MRGRAAGAGTGLARLCLCGCDFAVAGDCCSLQVLVSASSASRCCRLSAVWRLDSIGPNQALWAPARSRAKAARVAETRIRLSFVCRAKSCCKTTLLWRQAPISPRSRIMVSVNTPTLVLAFQSSPYAQAFPLCTEIPKTHTLRHDPGQRPARPQEPLRPEARRGLPRV